MDGLRDPALQLLLHGFFALLFARSALHKWRDPSAFQSALGAYEIVPQGATRGAAVTLGLAETAVTVGLLVPGAGGWPALAGAALLVLYSSAMAVAWARGLRAIDCGCGAPGSERPIGPDLMLRNVLLAALLLLATPSALVRSIGWLDWLGVLAAGAILVMLQAVLDQGLRQLRSMRAWRTPA